MKILIGNDIVDLKNPDIEYKHQDKRFLNRILSSSELEVFEKAEDKKLCLWKIWSGKEAAYKVIKKLYPKTVFSHSKFVVHFDSNYKSSGSLTYEGKHISLIWNSSDNWIHSVAIEKENEKHLEILEYDIKPLSQVSISTKGFSFKELESTYSSESAGVRNLTKSIMEKHMIEDAKIIRFPLNKKFSPPELYLSEIPLKNWDLSMSHDGKYVSCAVSKSL